MSYLDWIHNVAGDDQVHLENVTEKNVTCLRIVVDICVLATQINSLRPSDAYV